RRAGRRARRCAAPLRVAREAARQHARAVRARRDRRPAAARGRRADRLVAGRHQDACLARPSRDRAARREGAGVEAVPGAAALSGPNVEPLSALAWQRVGRGLFAALDREAAVPALPEPTRRRAWGRIGLVAGGVALATAAAAATILAVQPAHA